MQFHVVFAVFKRNFFSYFINPIGYLFITAFVSACAYFAFWHNNEFFSLGLAELSSLNQYFPFLLLFFIPAITMTAWSEERRVGTEELLLTLPARDYEIVLGKYLACVGIYTISLLFSTTNVIVLKILGNPDLGLIFSTYLGYWLAGITLIAVGLLASLFSRNSTVSFIWGVLLCLVFVSTQWLVSFIPDDAGLSNLNQTQIASSETPTEPELLGPKGDAEAKKETTPERDWNEWYVEKLTSLAFLRELGKQLSIAEQMQPFGKGLISLGSLFYFVVLIGVMLYLNTFLLSRRHWEGSRQAPAKWFHHLCRATSLTILGVSLTIIAQNAQSKAPYLKIDTTAEHIHTLSPVTREYINEIDPKRPVFIEAFISKYVAPEYVEVRADLLDKLNRLDSIGGEKVIVKVYDTEIDTKEARLAQENYGIAPINIAANPLVGIEQDYQFFLGVVLKSGTKQFVIPQFYKTFSVEYELVNVIRSVSAKEKKIVGVLDTQAMPFGMPPGPRNPNGGSEWIMIQELKKQYDQVVRLSPSESILETKDFVKTVDDKKIYPPVIVPQVSSLNNTQLQNVIDYILAGGPTIIIDDPLPVITQGQLAPTVLRRMNRPQNPMQPPPGIPPNIGRLTRLLNIYYQDDQTIRQPESGHPRLRLPDDWLFIGASGRREIIMPGHPITAGLREVLAIAPGFISPKKDGPKFTPLLRPNEIAYRMPFSTVESFGFPPQYPTEYLASQSQIFRLDVDEVHAIAANIEGKPTPDAIKAVTGEDVKKDDINAINVTWICDLDLVSDMVPGTLRQIDPRTFELDPVNADNVAFLLNCVDFWSGDKRIFDLRNNRPERRPLQYINRLQEQYFRDIEAKSLESKKRSKAAIDNAQKQMNEAQTELRKLKLDPRYSGPLLQTKEKALQREFREKKEEIEAQLRKEIQVARIQQRQALQSQEGWHKILAMGLPPTPALLIAIVVFCIRLINERVSVDQKRLI